MSKEFKKLIEIYQKRREALLNRAILNEKNGKNELAQAERELAGLYSNFIDDIALCINEKEEV